MKSKKKFGRSSDELQYIFNFLKKNWEKLHVLEKDQLEMELSVEEIFMNMVRHNSGSVKGIELCIEKNNEGISLSLTDFEQVPFDITKTKEIDFDEYFKEKRSGGLGIHLVKQFMDSVKFEHHDGVSTITITKHM